MSLCFYKCCHCQGVVIATLRALMPHQVRRRSVDAFRVAKAPNFACGQGNAAFRLSSTLLNVSTSPFFPVVFVLCHFVSVMVRWLGGSFAKLGFSVGLCGFANVPPNALAYVKLYSFFVFMSL